MSLNGLDAQEVTDAHNAAIVEVGGWFLLKYTSRDSVELLGRGKSGVHEARNELIKYEDKSPLYGLIIYRRRKILIKYIPEGTSRLLQARTAVHFQAVAERYAPYETILEISHPDELSDTSLASSFPLHTASPAVSTTRLDEISEDAEDGGNGALIPRPPMRTKSSTSAKFGTSRYKAERRVDQLMRSEQARPVSPAGSARSFHSLPASPPTGTKPSISQFLVREDSGTRSITSLTPSTSSLSEYAVSTAESDTSTVKETETIPSTVELQNPQDQAAEFKEDITNNDIPHAPLQAPSIREPSPERPSEATDRPVSTVYSDTGSQAMPELTEQVTVPERPKPDLDEPFDFSYLEAKPKIKLGPRPVAATEKHRKSGGNLGTSLLPAAYRSSKKQEQQRPLSTTPGGFLQPNQLNFPAPPPIPDVPEYNPRPISRGSVKSMPSQKSTTMTPEKLRLMKAVELRKKQMRKSNPQVKTPLVMDDAPEVPQVPVSSQDPPSQPIAQHVQPGSELAASREATSNPNVENDRGHEVGSAGPAAVTPSGKTQDEALGQPPGLLTSPSAVQDVGPQGSNSEPQFEAEEKSQETATEIQQRAGAVDSATPSPKALEHDLLPKTSSVSNEEHQSTHASTAQATATPIDTKPDAVDQNIGETAFSTSVDNLITDVPAIVTTASSRPQTADATTQREDFAPASREASSMESSGTLPTPSEETMKQMSDLAKRRRGLVEPLHIDVDTRRNSVADSLSDNELFEELQSATFHDAREMSVSKSPGPNTPFFPPNLGRSPSRESAASNSRSPVRAISITNGVSQPAQDVSPDQQLQQRAERDISVSPEPAQQPPSGLSSHSISPVDRNTPSPSLKRNVSSGITRRIQALNEMSTRETNTVPVHIPTRAMSPDQASMLLSNDRKPSMRSPHSRSGSAFRMRPHVERAGSNSPAVQQLESPPVWNTTHDNTSNRDSVSVKARIVRPNTAGSTERSGEKNADLHESQIEINHLRGTPTPTAVSQAFLPPMPSPPAEPASPDHRSLHSLRRKSFGRTKASNPGPTPANELQPGSASIASTEEHNGSRTSRFFKRMSNFGGGSSKRRSLIGASTASVASATPTETSASRAGSVAATPPPTAPAPANLDRDTPPAVQVGDLNVQFPDTLLWKRRWLSLDETGHLHLSPPTSQQTASQQHPRPGKKFHLSEFKAPCAPDLDRQELAHSICLEFAGKRVLNAGAGAESESEVFEGGVLQLACEDAMGQRQVLRLLGGYWRSWVGVEGEGDGS